jgi:hypothetical protein
MEKSWARWSTPVIPMIVRSLKWEGCGLGQPGQKVRPISKITTAERDGGMIEAIECLSSKHKALSLNPSTAQ